MSFTDNLKVSLIVWGRGGGNMVAEQRKNGIDSMYQSTYNTKHRAIILLR